MIYFDNGATTPVCNEAINAAVNAMKTEYANPSSIHRFGQSVKSELLNARKKIALFAEGFSADEVYFTSGGTEANNIAILGVLKKLIRSGGRICLSRTEHSSVSAPFKELTDKFEVVYFEPNKEGRITEEEIFSKINSNTVFVSLMLANNETGAINDVWAIRKAVKQAKANAIIHSDCVAAFGKVPLPSKKEVDLITVSGHKIRASKGVGVLYASSSLRLSPIVFGGGQEKGIRNGTENVPAIMSLSAAASLLIENFNEYKSHYDLLFKKGVELFSNNPKVFINSTENSSHAVLNLSVPKIPSEVMVRFLQDRDIFVSPGSACSSNKSLASSVLAAMKLSPDRQKSAFRISFGVQNTVEEVEALYNAICEAIVYFKV